MMMKSKTTRSLQSLLVLAMLVANTGCAPSNAPGEVNVRFQLPEQNPQLATLLEAELTYSGPDGAEGILLATPTEALVVGFPSLEAAPGTWTFVLHIRSLIHAGTPLLREEQTLQVRSGQPTDVTFVNLTPLDGDADEVPDWEEFWAGCNPTQEGCGPASGVLDPPSGSIISVAQPIRVRFGRTMDPLVAPIVGGTMAASPPLAVWDTDAMLLELQAASGWGLGTEQSLMVVATDSLGEPSEEIQATYEVRSPISVVIEPTGTSLGTSETIQLTYESPMDTSGTPQLAGGLGLAAEATWTNALTLRLAPSSSWPLGTQELTAVAYAETGQRVETQRTYDVGGDTPGIVSIVPEADVILAGTEDIVITFTEAVASGSVAITGALGAEREADFLEEGDTALRIVAPPAGWSDTGAGTAGLMVSATLAGTSELVSLQRNYTVDRVDPMLMTQVPADESRIETLEAITLTFSEPIFSASLTSGPFDTAGGTAGIAGGPGASSTVTVTPASGGWFDGPRQGGTLEVTDRANRATLVTLGYDVDQQGEHRVYVDAGAMPSGATGSSYAPFSTMGDALSLAASLDTQGLDLIEFRVAQGTYSETVILDLSTPVSLHGGYNALDWLAPPSLFSNVTAFQSASATTLLIRDTTGATVSQLHVFNTSASTTNQAVTLQKGNATIDSCVIGGSNASNSRGIYTSSFGSLTLRNSFVHAGGGSFAHGIEVSQTTLTLENNLIDASSSLADENVGVFSSTGGSTHTIRNNTIRAGLGGVTNQAIFLAGNTNAVVYNNLLIASGTGSTCVMIEGVQIIDDMRHNALIQCGILYANDTATATMISDTIDTQSSGVSQALDTDLGHTAPATDVATLFVTHQESNRPDENNWRLKLCDIAETNYPVCSGADPGNQTATDRDGIERRLTVPAVGAFESPEPM